MSSSRLPSVTLLMLLAVPSLAQAWELVDRRLYFNTYGTLAVAGIDKSDAQIENRNDQAIDNTPSGGYDSRVGLQFEYRLTEQLGLSWQGLATEDDSSSYQLDTKWAYLGYQPTPWLDLKVGRFINPLYQISEQQYVGYSQPWVRPPLEVYALTGDFDSSDGLRTTFTLPTKELDISVDLFVSRYESDDGQFKTTIEPFYGAVLDFGRRNLSLRLMAAQAVIDVEGANAEVIKNLLQQPQAEHRYLLDADLTYYNAAIQYNDARWWFLAEYLQNRSDSHLFPEIEAFTVTLGRYIGSFLPFVTYSKRNILNLEPETGLTGIAAATANEFINNRRQGQSTVGGGLRWDIRPGIAIKTQWDHLRVPGGSRGVFEQPPGEHVNLYTLSMDWAF